jgi:arylsulfatase A-like enzyme
MGFNGFLTGFQYLSLDMGFDFVSEFAGVPENTVRMTDGVLEWLEEHKDEKFFLLVWYDPPHFPYNAPREYVDQAYAAGLDREQEFFDPRYLAKMLYGDEHFGRLAAGMERLGLNDTTLFVVTADHGEAMDPRHAGRSHNVNTRVTRHHGKTFYDEEIHVPLLLRLDGTLEAGRDVSSLVSLMSLGPTIQELLGHPHVESRRMGRSFAGLAQGETEAQGRTAYFEGRWSYGIRTQRYKYIYHDRAERLTFQRASLWERRRDGPNELFDVQVDPYEVTNLASSRPELLGQMRSQYWEARRAMRAFRRTQLRGAISRPIEELPEETE